MADPQSEKFHNSVECNSKEISEDAGPGNGSCTYWLVSMAGILNGH